MLPRRSHRSSTVVQGDALLGLRRQGLSGSSMFGCAVVKQSNKQLASTITSPADIMADAFLAFIQASQKHAARGDAFYKASSLQASTARRSVVTLACRMC